MQICKHFSKSRVMLILEVSYINYKCLFKITVPVDWIAMNKFKENPKNLLDYHVMYSGLDYIRLLNMAFKYMSNYHFYITMFNLL